MNMDSNIAPLHGTSSLYCYLPYHDKVMIQRSDYRFIVVNKDTFTQLYVELDDTRAALKDDCIEYTVYEYDKPLSSYPDWFIEAYDNGDIFEEDYGKFIFYDANGDIAMSPGSVVLRNFKGDLMYMESETFSKYYEVTGG